MSMFDDTVGTAKAWLDLATQKTIETVEQQKIRLAIAKKKSDLSHLYEVLGQLYYRHRADCADHKGVQTLCQDIALVQSEIDDLQKQLEAPSYEDMYEE